MRKVTAAEEQEDVVVCTLCAAQLQSEDDLDYCSIQKLAQDHLESHPIPEGNVCTVPHCGRVFCCDDGFATHFLCCKANHMGPPKSNTWRRSVELINNPLPNGRRYHDVLLGTIFLQEMAAVLSQ